MFCFPFVDWDKILLAISYDMVYLRFIQGPEVRSGDVPRPIQLKEGQEFNFTIRRGVSTENTVSVNYDDFVNDVEVGDILLVDGENRFHFDVFVNWVLSFVVESLV